MVREIWWGYGQKVSIKVGFEIIQGCGQDQGQNYGVMVRIRWDQGLGLGYGQSQGYTGL